MTNEIIEIDKAAVMHEVAKTTSYVGAKMTEDADAYDRMMTTDEDMNMLERFWNECCSSVCDKLRYRVRSVTTVADHFRIGVVMASAFDVPMRQGIKEDLFSYFVMGITAKWFAFTNKGEAKDYASEAEILLEGAHRKLCLKMKPTRPIYK